MVFSHFDIIKKLYQISDSSLHVVAPKFIASIDLHIPTYPFFQNTERLLIHECLFIYWHWCATRSFNCKIITSDYFNKQQYIMSFLSKQLTDGRKLDCSTTKKRLCIVVMII